MDEIANQLAEKGYPQGKRRLKEERGRLREKAGRLKEDFEGS